MTIETMKLSDIHPYANNPRKNDDAVDAVAESILQCGYIAPIIVDESGVILAGHTRYKALKKLGKSECQVMVAPGLTDEQKRKYRLLDNKTAEFSGWDFQMLEEELDGLNFAGVDFGFELGGFDGIEELFDDAPPKKEKKEKSIKCPHCGELFTP